jgi:hypothetical protein
MKTKFIPLLIAAAMLCAAAAGAEDQKNNITQEQANGIAEMITRPVREVVKPAADKAGKDLYDALISQYASSWALWDLLNGLSDQQKAARKPEPDPDLVETYLRLRMRCNTADLCPGNSACKAYPGDKDFARMTQAAASEIKIYAAGFRGKSPLMPRHRARIENILETARKRTIFSLKMTRRTNVDPASATPAEEKYRQLALEKREGSEFKQPPWP